MRYAVSEILLIVVGVTLALTANSWYAGVKERREELLALQQIQVALESDIQSFSKFRKNLHDSERDIGMLVEALQSQSPPTERIADNLGQVLTWQQTQIRTGPYEEIKNRGFSLISSPSLRSALIDLYDRAWPRVDGVSLADREYSAGQLAEYFDRNLVRSSVDLSSWTPLHGYSALRQDPYFRNLVVRKLNRLRQYFIPAADDFEVAARKVLSETDEQISRLGG